MKDDKGGSKERRELEMVGLRREMKSEKIYVKSGKKKGNSNCKNEREDGIVKEAGSFNKTESKMEVMQNYEHVSISVNKPEK